VAPHLQIIKPVSKVPVSMLVKLRYAGPLSNFAINFNLRRYKEVTVNMGVYIFSKKAMEALIGAKPCDTGRAVQVHPRLTPG